MMTAEQARAELKKDAVDRLSEEESAQIKSSIEALKENLKNNLKIKIEEAVVNGHSKTAYTMSMAAPTPFPTPSVDWRVFEDCVIDIYPHYGIATQLMRREVDKQVEELKGLGYRVDFSATCEGFLEEHNSIRLDISWEEDEESEQGKEKEKQYEEKEATVILNDKDKGYWAGKVKSWF